MLHHKSMLLYYDISKDELACAQVHTHIKRGCPVNMKDPCDKYTYLCCMSLQCSPCHVWKWRHLTATEGHVLLLEYFEQFLLLLGLPYVFCVHHIE